MSFTDLLLIENEGKHFSAKISGNTIICSQHIISDVIFLRMKPGFDDRIKELIDSLRLNQNPFTKNYIIVLPSHVEILRPVPSAEFQDTTTCEMCGGTMRTLGVDEYTCLACGHRKVRKFDHLQRVINLTGSGGGSETL